jgi:hypothetical protein
MRAESGIKESEGRGAAIRQKNKEQELFLLTFMRQKCIKQATESSGKEIFSKIKQIGGNRGRYFAP